MPRRFRWHTHYLGQSTRANPVTDLPVEILELVYEHLLAKDLLPWRLTCRVAVATSRRAVARLFITERPFLYNFWCSMQKFVEITEDEDLRPHLKAITLSLVGLVDKERNDQLLWASAEEEGATYDREYRSGLREHKAYYDVLRKEPDRARAEGAPTVLAGVIKALQQLDIHIGIIVEDVGFTLNAEQRLRHPENPVPWGIDRLRDVLGHRNCMSDELRYPSGWDHLFEALRQAEAAPSTLELGNLRSPVNIISMNTHWLGPSSALKPFRNLTSLRLRLSIKLDKRIFVGIRVIQALKQQSILFLQCFGAALLHVSKLQTLGLTVGQETDDIGFLKLHVWSMLHELDQRALMALSRLELSGQAVNSYELMHFIGLRRATLRGVSMRWISDTPSSHSLFKDIKRYSEDETLSAHIRAWVGRVLHKGTVTEWRHMYDGKPWDREERLADVLP